jgi:hypothetical protein
MGGKNYRAAFLPFCMLVAQKNGLKKCKMVDKKGRRLRDSNSRGETPCT